MVLCVKKHKRDVTLPTKVLIVKAMVFPVVTYKCESWATKKAQYKRIDDFKLWYWILRVLWIARRSDQSILKEINPEYWVEGLMLKLRLQYSGHLMQRTISLEKTDAGKDWKQKGRRGQRMRWLDSTTDSTHMNVKAPGARAQRGLARCSPWGHEKSGRPWRLHNRAPDGVPQVWGPVHFSSFFCFLFLNWICAYLNLDLNLIKVKILFPNSLISFFCQFKSTLEPL